MDPMELIQQGQRFFVEKKFREAAEAFTKALEAGASPRMCLLSRGAAHLKLQDYDSAEEDFTQIIEESDGNARALFYRGTVRMMKDNFMGAVEDLSSSIKANSENGMAFFLRGAALANLGRDEEAATDMKTAMSFSEINIQGFVDSLGIQRTQFDRVMALISGERKFEEMNLTEEEEERLKGWLAEGETED